MELFDGEETDEEDDASEEDDSSNSESEQEEASAESNATQASDHDTAQATTNPAPHTNESLALFDEIGDPIKSVRSRATTDIRHHVTQIDNAFQNIRRKLVKKRQLDGILQNALDTRINPSASDLISDDESDVPSQSEVDDVDEYYDDRNLFDEDLVGDDFDHDVDDYERNAFDNF